MTESTLAKLLRDKIISDPEMILEDRDLMRALVAASETALGENVVDLRGAAMARLERRLDRLEDTHRSVIAAAYENLAGTNQIHRAVLALLEPVSLPQFLANLSADVSEILRLDCVRLVLETHHTGDDPALDALGDVLRVAEPGFAQAYLQGGYSGVTRSVVLRPISAQGELVYGDASAWLKSEAVMKLDLGPGRLPGLLVMAAENPDQFKSSQGTDLLGFFAGVFERKMRGYLL